MHNIRKIGIRLLLIFVVIFFYEILVEFAYRPYREIIIMHNQERKEMDGTIETIICGTSLAQRGFDSKVIDEKLDTISFNMGTSLQPLDGSYHIIKDMAETNPIETVYITMAPDSMKRDVLATKYKAYVYDRLDGVGSKMKYLIDACDIEEWPYLSLYSVRIEDYVQPKEIKMNITTKLKSDYDTGAYCNKFYRGQGQMSLNRAYKAKKPAKVASKSFCGTKLAEKNLKALDEIVAYCKENKIELIFLYMPLTGDDVREYKDYGKVHDYYENLANDYDVPFWDFNYYKNADTIFTNEMFEDGKHLNVKGAAVFSEELAKVYKLYHEGGNLSELFMEASPYSEK